MLLLVAGVLLLAKPLSRAMRHHAEAAAFAAPKKHVVTRRKQVVVSLPKLTRDETKVFVLNGNGRSGAAATKQRSCRRSATACLRPETHRAATMRRR